MNNKLTKKDTLLIIVDGLILSWSIYSIAKSVSSAIFYGAFIYWFIIPYFIMRRESPEKMRNINIENWEKLLYVYGAGIIIFNVSPVEKLFTNKEDFYIWSVLLNSFLPALGAFIFFIRGKNYFLKVKNYLIHN